MSMRAIYILVVLQFFVILVGRQGTRYVLFSSSTHSARMVRSGFSSEFPKIMGRHAGFLLLPLSFLWGQVAIRNARSTRATPASRSFM